MSRQDRAEPGVSYYDSPAGGGFLMGSWRPATEEELARTRRPRTTAHHPAEEIFDRDAKAIAGGSDVQENE